jgi:AcrR family transcriptional regulator
MPARDKTEQVRQQIIDATDSLLYRKGFNLMSFSDIAETSGIPRGNLYYYFKTKDEVLTAVIEHRLAQMRRMLHDWEQTFPTPLERLQRYAQVPINELDNVIRFGCPMGSLNSELGKAQQELQAVARQQLELFRKWLVKQFKQLNPNMDAKSLAMHLLVRTQGLALMAQVYADRTLVRREVEAIAEWLAGVADQS